jgi:glycosyltransferase involved in cell wall biosynthesis
MKSLIPSRQKPNRILYINQMSVLYGGEMALFDLMANLDSSQFQPLFLCRSPGPFTDLCAKYQIQTIFVPSLPRVSGRARDSIKTLLPNAIAIAKIAKKEKIDLIHSNGSRVAYHGGLAARLAGLPSVVHVRDCYKTPFQSLAKSIFLRALSDRVIAISKAAYSSVIDRLSSLKNITQLIYDGVAPLPRYSPEEITAFRNEFRMNGCIPLLAVVGSFSDLKAQMNAVLAMPIILSQFPDARLLIVGDAYDKPGEIYKQNIIFKIRELNLGRNIILTGFRKDIPLLMSSIDFLLHTPVFPEGLGRVILEASFQGAVVIASDIGGISEIIIDGQTGKLVRPGDPDQIASSVIDLLNNPSKADRIRKAALDRVQDEFALEKCVNKIQNIYNELLCNWK